MKTLYEKVKTEKGLSDIDTCALMKRVKRVLSKTPDKFDKGLVLFEWLSVTSKYLTEAETFKEEEHVAPPTEEATVVPANAGSLTVDGVTLADEQMEAYDIMQKIPKGGMLFVTGRAGTGKSTLIDCFCQGRNDVVRLASTGIAAQNINGRTLDSFLGLRPDNTWTIDPFKLIQRLSCVQFVVIDEISMVGLEKFDFMLDHMFKSLKSLKIIFVGDFAQLPPVKDHYCYSSSYWPDVHCIELTQIHRQNDPEFIACLNAVREGNTSDAVVQNIYRERSVYEGPNDTIVITPHVKTAEILNNHKLSLLDSDPASHEADIIIGKWKPNRLPQTVYYAEGCRVLMLNNEREKRWCNGSLGTITEVKDYAVKVAIDGGDVEYVSPIEFEMYNGDGKVILRFIQYPFQLGYAITIHKSQGITLDKVTIDMANHFGKGMTYVALSRCRSKEGLYLTNVRT